MHSIELHPIINAEEFKPGDDLSDYIVSAHNEGKLNFNNGDILCIASKIVSIEEGEIIDLSKIIPSEKALEIHQIVPNKDPRVIEIMLNITTQPDGTALRINGSYIGGQLPSGLILTSAGIDKLDGDKVALLPKNPDKSAERIGKLIYQRTHKKIAVIITDSDGRDDRGGSTQLTVGLYGIQPYRQSSYTNDNGEKKQNQETLCDLIAAAAGILMGQRGNGIPLVVVQGIDYTFDENATLDSILHKRSLS